MRINNRVANLCDFIDKNHYISLQDLCSISKVSDIAKSKNSHNFLAWNNNIHKVRVLDNL
jgi:hypothetical protein